MPGRYLLDTNAAIAALEGDNPLRELPQGVEGYVNIVALGELHYGAQKSARPAQNRERIARLLELCPALDCNNDTARQYGRIKAQLRTKGRPIPDNDLWIAASALQHGLVLITRDRHFDHVDGLDLQDW